MKWTLLILMSLGFAASAAEDLEGLLSGKVETQNARNTSYFAETLRGLLGNTTPDQNFFLQHLEKSNWTESLLSWNAAFAGTEFEKSVNGKAVHAYLYFQSGLVITGLEELFTVNEPKKMHFHLMSLWREAAPESHPAWVFSRIAWKGPWTEIFGAVIEVRVLANDLSKSRQIEELNSLAIRAPVGSKERALIDWNLALAYAQKDQADKAAKIISALMKAPNNPVPVDLLNLTAARMLYQNGYFEVARKYNDKVPKKSEDYLEAQEEKAWSYLRQGKSQDALAVTQTLVNPIFTGQVGPETWFLRGLSALKVCDYAGVSEVLQKFPKEFKDRSIALEMMVKSGESAELKTVLEKLKERPMTRSEVIKVAKYLPRELSRDEKLRFLLSAQAILEKEAAQADKLFSQSLSQASPQGYLDTLKKQVLERAQVERAAVKARALELAQNELSETKRILVKMHIVEAELIQRLDSSGRLSKESNQKLGSTGSQAKDVLKFPFEKEFWFDELTNYKVDIKKGCQARASL